MIKELIQLILEFLGLRWRDRGFVGLWNGKPIVGFSIGLRFRLTWWTWKPVHSAFSPLYRWLCFGLMIEWEYGNTKAQL
jgi:hypothetical protein